MGWSGVEWSGVEWSGVEWGGVEWSRVGWSGVEWSGVEESGVECNAAAHLDALLPECCEAVQSLGVVHVAKGLPDQFQNDILELL